MLTAWTGASIPSPVALTTPRIAFLHSLLISVDVVVESPPLFSGQDRSNAAQHIAPNLSLAECPFAIGGLIPLLCFLENPSELEALPIVQFEVSRNSPQLFGRPWRSIPGRRLQRRPARLISWNTIARGGRRLRPGVGLDRDRLHCGLYWSRFLYGNPSSNDRQSTTEEPSRHEDRHDP